jgi:hypothetical protein
MLLQDYICTKIILWNIVNGILGKNSYGICNPTIPQDPNHPKFLWRYVEFKKKLVCGENRPHHCIIQSDPSLFFLPRRIRHTSNSKSPIMQSIFMILFCQVDVQGRVLETPPYTLFLMLATNLSATWLSVCSSPKYKYPPKKLLRPNQIIVSKTIIYRSKKN